jgi:hypothetical protein
MHWQPTNHKDTTHNLDHGNTSHAHVVPPVRSQFMSKMHSPAPVRSQRSCYHTNKHRILGVKGTLVDCHVGTTWCTVTHNVCMACMWPQLFMRPAVVRSHASQPNHTSTAMSAHNYCYGQQQHVSCCCRTVRVGYMPDAVQGHGRCAAQHAVLTMLHCTLLCHLGALSHRAVPYHVMCPWPCWPSAVTAA